MELKFLGTSAAPSMPIPFCVCQVCSTARRSGGRNLRRRSSLAINDDLLVDIGPDIATASFEYSVSIAGISFCLLTHAHEDHFDPEFIMSRHEEYGTVLEKELLLTGSIDALRSIDVILGRRCAYGSIFERNTQEALRVSLRAVEPFTTHVYPAAAKPLEAAAAHYDREVKSIAAIFDLCIVAAKYEPKAFTPDQRAEIRSLVTRALKDDRNAVAQIEAALKTLETP